MGMVTMGSIKDRTNSNYWYKSPEKYSENHMQSFTASSVLNVTMNEPSTKVVADVWNRKIYMIRFFHFYGIFVCIKHVLVVIFLYI